MKYLIVIVLALVVVWLWRSNRRAEQQDRQAGQPATRPDKPVTEVVACAVCAVHLPRADALPGGRGFYCSDAHRRQAEGG
jgi:uncharacterized protein